MKPLSEVGHHLRYCRQGTSSCIEEWESDEAHQEHLSQEWLREVGAALQPFAIGPFEMQRLRKARLSTDLIKEWLEFRSIRRRCQRDGEHPGEDS